MSIGSVREFMNLILDRSSGPDYVTAYRGLTDASYPLQPSVFREQISREQEHILLRELIAAHPDDFAADDTTLEQLVRMQHYALPTRLLDVSWNPLVALFFAAQENRKLKEEIDRNGRKVRRYIKTNGCVAILTIPKEKVKYFDSDTVSCIANLSKLHWEHKQAIDTGIELKKFNKTTPVKRLVHFIRQEKNQFEPEIVPSDLDSIILVKPKLNNRRILAQNGAFFVFGKAELINEPNDLGIRVERVVVRVRAKKRIIDELDKLNINEKTLFPEIERSAKYFASNNLQHMLVSSILSRP